MEQILEWHQTHQRLRVVGIRQPSGGKHVRDYALNPQRYERPDDHQHSARCGSRVSKGSVVEECDLHGEVDRAGQGEDPEADV